MSTPITPITEKEFNEAESRTVPKLVITETLKKVYCPHTAIHEGWTRSIFEFGNCHLVLCHRCADQLRGEILSEVIFNAVKAGTKEKI